MKINVHKFARLVIASIICFLAVKAYYLDRERHTRTVLISELKNRLALAAKDESNSNSTNPNRQMTAKEGIKSTDLLSIINRVSKSSGIVVVAAAIISNANRLDNADRATLDITLRGSYPAVKNAMSQTLQHNQTVTTVSLSLKRSAQSISIASSTSPSNPVEVEARWVLSLPNEQIAIQP